MQSFISILKTVKRNAVLKLFALVLVLRLLVVLITCSYLMETKSFSWYVFTDSVAFHKLAIHLEETGLGGIVEETSASHANYARLTALAYRVFGQHFYVMMIFNSFFSSCAVVLVFFIGKECFDRRVGLFAAIIYAFFPSAVFWGSQHMRDPLIALLNLLAVFFFLRMLSSKSFMISTLCMALTLFGATILRPQMSLVMLLSVSCFFVILLFSRTRRAMLSLISGAGVSSFCYFGWCILPASFLGVLETNNGIPPDRGFKAPNQLLFERLSSIPLVSYISKPVQAILLSRYNRLQTLADPNDIRPIKTVLFPDWWPPSLSAIFFMELKLVFFVLFMPLPGLYPLEGNMIRIFASLENAAFLLLCCIAAAGLIRLLLQKNLFTPERVFLLLYLGVFVGLYAFFAPDLGSAMRYKLQFVPFFSIFISAGLVTLWQKHLSSASQDSSTKPKPPSSVSP